MQIGPENMAVREGMSDLNVTWANEIKMLGFTITNEWEKNLEINFADLTRKIVNLINYWKRCGLSMIGRITVYKSLILPHINFICSVLTPPEKWYVDTEKLLEKFVLGSETFSKNRLYLPVTKGGLGLVNIRNFVVAVQCSWIKKAILSTNDTWKLEIKNSTDDFSNFVSTGTKGIIKNLINSYNTFQLSWTKKNNNFLQVPVLGNPNFGYGRGLAAKFDANFFKNITGAEVEMDMNWIARLKWADMCDNENIFYSPNALSTLLDLNEPISRLEYNKLKSGFGSAFKKHFKRGKSGAGLYRYLRDSNPKGLSKNIRKRCTYKTSVYKTSVYKTSTTKRRFTKRRR
jgi:hypothetical protein